MRYKTIEAYEWSAGNGQCPACFGNRPDMGWWTDTIGHHKGCPLATTMEAAGKPVVWEHENPERVVGTYIPNYGEKGNHFVAHIRANDPDKEEKLAIGSQQLKDMGFPVIK